MLQSVFTRASKPNNATTQATQKPGFGVHTSTDELLQLRYLAKDIRLETRKKSTSIVAGDSATNYRGRGMEFAEVRLYQPGDDVRNIDWRVTARTTETYTKLFQEERERPVYLVVDQRASMFFGSVTQFKSVYAATIASVLAWAALQNNDRIGALLFSDHHSKDLRARRGKHAVLRFIHELCELNQALSSPIAEAEHPQINENDSTGNVLDARALSADASGSIRSASSKVTLDTILTDIRRVARPGSAVFIISDFHDFSHDSEKSLALLGRHTETSLIHTYDPLEQQLPSAHSLTISDGKQRLSISAGANSFRKNFRQNWLDHQQQLQAAATNTGAKLIDCPVNIEPTDFIRNVFVNKKRKGGR